MMKNLPIQHIQHINDLHRCTIRGYGSKPHDIAEEYRDGVEGFCRDRFLGSQSSEDRQREHSGQKQVALLFLRYKTLRAKLYRMIERL